MCSLQSIECENRFNGMINPQTLNKVINPTIIIALIYIRIPTICCTSYCTAIYYKRVANDMCISNVCKNRHK